MQECSEANDYSSWVFRRIEEQAFERILREPFSIILTIITNKSRRTKSGGDIWRKGGVLFVVAHSTNATNNVWIIQFFVGWLMLILEQVQKNKGDTLREKIVQEAWHLYADDVSDCRWWVVRIVDAFGQ